MKSIHWLIPLSINNPEELNKVSLASLRLRTAIFLDSSIKNNFNVSFGSNSEDKVAIESDILFVGKPVHDIQIQKKWLNLISKHQNVVIDITDDHLNNKTPLTNFYNNALECKPKIITSSNLLKKITKETKLIKNIFTIEDYLELDIYEVTKNNNREFLWFGHEVNRFFLYEMLQKWKSKLEFNLHIMSSYQGVNLICEELPKIKTNTFGNISVQQWSINNLLNIRKNISGIVIPGNLNDRRKIGVSNNRLITSFALGIPVAATRYDSYLEFKDFFCNIDDESEFNLFIENNNLYKEKIPTAQKLLTQYSRQEIVKKWTDFLNSNI